MRDVVFSSFLVKEKVAQTPENLSPCFVLVLWFENTFKKEKNKFHIFIFSINVCHPSIIQTIDAAIRSRDLFAINYKV